MADFTFTDNSAAVLAAMSRQLRTACVGIGQKAVRHAKAEIQREGRVDTGALRDSIRYTVQRNAVYIGTDNKHAAFHELGTGRFTKPHRAEHYGISPLHFLQHAASRYRREYLKILEKAMKS